MRNILYILSATVILVSCGGPVTDADVAKHRATRDSLKTAREELNAAIADVEAWLAKNDPELQRTLPTVTTFELKARPFAHYTEAHGSVKADENALVYSSTGGEVRRILVKPGQPVSKGQLIVDIDTDVLRSNMAQAETNARLAQDVFQRQAKLWEQKIGSEMQYLEAKSRKEAAEAQLSALREQLRNAQVAAPFAGIVDEVFPTVGDMTTSMQPVARVVSLGKSSIECDLSEDMLEKVQLNDPVEVVLPESGETLQATIDQIGQYINPNNRTFRITLRMDNGSKLRPNQLANVRIRDMEAEEALVIPSRLVMENAEGKSYVYVLVDDGATKKAKKVFVKVLSAQGGELMIAKEEGGLQGTEVLIDQGSRLVVNDQEVQLVKGV
ncbi:MAG: efflux RND transporter periplasmic adaptor subunit [Flavobacteriales bacterium]